MVRTRSLEEAVHIQSSVTAPCRAELLDRRRAFYWEANRTSFGPLSLMASRYGAGTRARSCSVSQLFFSLLLSVHGGGSAKQARKSSDLVPGRVAALCSPSLPTEIVLASGYEGRSIGVPAPFVESMLDALTGVSRTDPLRFDVAVDIEGRGGPAIRLLEFLVREADAGGGAIRSPLVETRLAESFVCALLSGVPHSQTHLFATKPKLVEPRCVRRAEEYIDANAHQPIGLADLAAATGVPVRTLTAAFRRYRGYSPMAFLRTRRFELARKRLAATPTTTVAAVALSCGFEHLGRFSVGYRARFGEGASETLRRGRRAMP